MEELGLSSLDKIRLSRKIILVPKYLECQQQKFFSQYAILY